MKTILQFKNTIIHFICVFLAVLNPVFGQNQLEVKKGVFVDSLNRYYQQAELPVYFYVATEPNSQGIALSSSDEEKKLNPLKPIYLDGHGKHAFKHADTKHNREDQFVIYADGIAPITQRKFEKANIYQSGNNIYYGKGLTVKLESQDEMSGVKQIFSSLDKAEYSAYSKSLNLDKEGDYQLKYYAIDNVGNTEKVNEYNFIVDTSSPVTYHNIIGIAQGNIISSTTKIYLSPNDSLSGIAQTFYYIDDGQKKPYTVNTTIPFIYLEDGEHTLYYYSIDRVGNQEKEGSFTFYYDKSSPIMSADILGDRFIVGDKIYFSGRTKLKLTAVDNKSGIKQVMYSVDEKAFEEYENPFYLPNKSGFHRIKYFAIDNIGNQGVYNQPDKPYDEFTHNVGLVYVDLTGPILSHQFKGPLFKKGDSLYINSTTKIEFSAKDEESGLQKITYNIDNPSEETDYKNAILISTPGFHKVSYFGYDNVNNRNIKSFEVVVDNEGPVIHFNFSNVPTKVEGNISTYPSYSVLFLAVTDAQTGYGNITYSINDGKESVYTGGIQGFDKSKKYKIKVKATDKLGNESSQTIEFKTDSY